MLSKLRSTWPSLVLEGLAVLVGVLLAFWVDSLGQARSDQQRVLAHLEALTAELGRNQDLIESSIESGQDYVEAIERYLATVVLPPDGIDPDVGSVTAMLERLGPPRQLEYQRGALDDLLSGGGLPLVRDDTLRQAVLTYARLLADEAGTQQARERFWADQIGPYYWEHGSLLDFMPIGEELMLEPRSPVVEAFVRSRQFSNLLAERRAFEIRLLSRRGALRDQLELLDSLIG